VLKKEQKSALVDYHNYEGVNLGETIDIFCKLCYNLGMKTCNICKSNKEESNFYSRNGKFRASCRNCDASKAKEKYWKNEQYRANKLMKSKERRKEFPQLYVYQYSYRASKYRFHANSKIPRVKIDEVYKKYNSECDLCHANEHLTIHHIDGKGRYWAKKNGGEINNDISNLQLLCRVCHGAIDGPKSRKISDEKIFLIKELHKKNERQIEISRLLNIPVHYVAYWQNK
jgi:HNH endonuclease